MEENDELESKINDLKNEIEYDMQEAQSKIDTTISDLKNEIN